MKSQTAFQFSFYYGRRMPMRVCEIENWIIAFSFIHVENYNAIVELHFQVYIIILI